MQRQDLSPSTVARIDALRQKYPTIANFGTDYSPQFLDKFSRFPTRCIFGTAPTLIDLNLSYSNTASVQWLIAQLAVFQEQINVPNKMTTSQIDACAQIISERFGYLKTSEIMLFLSRLKGGLYNVDWYGYINPDKIVTALADNYLPYRNNLYYKHQEQERRRKEAERAKEPVVTWEEYCAMKGISKKNPLSLD